MILDKAYNWIQLKYRKVEHGKNLNIVGKIMIQGHGKVAIGNDVKIFSRWDKNPVGGGTGRSVLQTIGNGTIGIGNASGLSHVTLISRNRISIGNNVLLGGGVQIYDNDFHQINYKDRQDNSLIKSAPVIIEDNVFVGANTIILKGVTIGNGSVVGAGSVVTKSIPAGEIWAGNPAAFIKKIQGLE